MAKDKGKNRTRNNKLWKIGETFGKRPPTFFKKMSELERGKGTFGGGMSRP